MSPRALALATVLVLAVSGLAAGQASGTDRRPGEVLGRTERPDGAIDVRYRSSGVAQTAVVWLPPGERSGDVVAWGHSTTGLADGCEPSAGEPVVPGLDALLAAGHVVVAPDYEGLGVQGDHPYLVGASAGRSLLDAIRAARAVADVDGRSVAYGWSQGGHAALFAARLGPDHAPDVDLVGVAAVAPVTDVGALVDGTSPFSAYPGFVAMVAAGYAAEYPELDPVALVPDAGALSVARNRCALDVAAALDDASIADPGAGWERRLRQNDATRKRLDVPVLLVHGEQDALLPLSDTIRAYHRLCARGSTVRLERYEDAEHGSVSDLSTDEVVRWLDARLQGTQLTGCAQRRS